MLQALRLWPHQVCHGALGPRLALQFICTDTHASGPVLCVPSCAGHCGETGGSARPQTFNHRRFHFLLLMVELS